MDRYVGRVVYPDWYVESIDMWTLTIPLKVFLIVTWIKYQDRSPD